MNSRYEQLIRSERVTSATRKVLLQRESSQAQELPPFLFAVGHEALKAMVQRLVPQQPGADWIDIATELGARRKNGTGDGWRYSSLPPDDVALVRGLELLDRSSYAAHDTTFALLDADKQDDLLNAVQNGKVDWPELDARRWFEEVLAEATEIFVSHPATLAAMGYSGIAFLPRWTAFGLKATQPWEPRAATPETTDHSE